MPSRSLYPRSEAELQQVRERITRLARLRAFEECTELGEDWAVYDFPIPRPGLHDPDASQRDARYRANRDLLFRHAEQQILAHNWDPDRYDHAAAERKVLAMVRQSATAVGMPEDAFGALARRWASPAAIPVPHRDVRARVRRVVAILDGLTAAEQRTVLREAAKAVQC